MHSNYLLMALSAVGAMAVPLEKRDVVTDVDVVTQTVVATAYVTAQPATDDSVVVVTKTVGVHGHPHHGGHHSHHAAAHPPPSVYTTVVQPSPSAYSTPEPSSQPPAPTKPAPAPVLDSYSSKVVFHHNIHRLNHTSPELSWDQGLADTAQKIASSCYYAHNTDMDGGGYGQNIAAGTKPEDIAQVVTDEFYNGEVNAYANYYGVENPPDFEVWGHFSQVVWKATTHVGCYTQYCPGGLSSDVPMTGIAPYFTVCNYKEVGNMGGAYVDNVLQPLGWTSVDASYDGPVHVG